MIWFHTIPIVNDLNGMMNNGQIQNLSIIPFTLFGMYQSGEVIKLLPKPEYIPSEYVKEYTESNFDYFYWKQLSEDPSCFLEKMRILKPEYENGRNTIIMIQTSDDPVGISITESIIGFLKTFYGIQPKLITCYEDLYDPDLLTYEGFSYEGLLRISDELIKYESQGWL